MKFQHKFVILLLIVGSVVAIAGGIATSLEMDSYFYRRLATDLQTHARGTEQILYNFIEPSADQSYKKLRDLAHTFGIRLTLISSDGKVVFESGVPRDKLETIDNHLNRPEVRRSLAEGTAFSQRYSGTMKEDMMYFAMKLSTPVRISGTLPEAVILRVSIPLAGVQQTINDLRLTIISAVAGTLVLLVLVTLVVSKRFTRPITDMARAAENIRAGDLEQRIIVRSNDEFGKLAETLNGMIDKLNADIAQFKKLERVRSEFLGNVSHELRTPLFALQGAIETLLNGAIDDPDVNRDFLGKALHHTQRLDELLSDLIEISRIESGEMKMSFRYFDLNEFLQEVAGEMQQEADKKGIALSHKPVPGSMNVLGDKERLRQAMENLLSNAIKYTDSRGSVTIMAESANGSVRISVADTGCGIPAEHIPRIFERFYRVDKDRSREVGGSGLGLAIVKHIVEAHGSKVEVESVVGKGSVFSFRLRK